MNITQHHKEAAREAYMLHTLSPSLTGAELADELYRFGFSPYGGNEKFSSEAALNLAKIGEELSGGARREAATLLKGINTILRDTYMDEETKLTVIRRIVGG